jgi:hypothetical protein
LDCALPSALNSTLVVPLGIPLLSLSFQFTFDPPLTLKSPAE